MPHLACSVDCFSSWDHQPFSIFRLEELPGLPTWLPSHRPPSLLPSHSPWSGYLESAWTSPLVSIPRLPICISLNEKLRTFRSLRTWSLNLMSSSSLTSQPSEVLTVLLTYLHFVLFPSSPLSHSCLGHIISLLDFQTLFSSQIPEGSF